MTTIPRKIDTAFRPDAGAEPAAPAVCAHCSLPVPENLRIATREEQFCCGGCEVAFDTIRACGMGEYYALRDAIGAEAEPARTAPGRFAELDDPVFAERHVTELPGGLRAVELYIEGLHCAACVWLLERLPTQAPGLRSIEVDLFRRTARVCWDGSETSLSSIAQLLSRFGYAPHPVEPSVARDSRRNEDRTYLIRIGVAAACAGNVMLLAFALYSGEFSSIGEPYLSLFRWASALIGLLSVVWPGRVFFAGALAAVRARTWHLDMPIALALAVGTAAGLVSVARGSGEIYFDSISTLILLLLIGRWLQLRQQRSAADAIEMLFSVTPRRVAIVRDGIVEEASIDSVSPGDLVEVGPSGCVPVDGVIETGVTSMDNSILSGESRPLPGGPGDAVVAGAVNLGATIRVRVEAAGRETRVGRLMADIEKLGRSRTPIIGSADRIARPFVLGVLASVVVCLLVQIPAGIEGAVQSAVALLIVCCPCAVAMATPLATSITIGRLARRGVLVKGGDCLEALAGRPELVLDKTGTITDGVFGVVNWIGDESTKPIVAALESGGSHPIALALARCAEPEAGVSDIDHRLGLGVVGRLGNETFGAGSSRLATEIRATIPQWAIDASHDASQCGLTPVLIYRNTEAVAVAVLGDKVREHSRGVIASLAGLGWNPRIVSGDHAQTVEAVAGAVGVEKFAGGVDPEGKKRIVEDLRKLGPVVAVGDGVNDAAALAAATVGVSVKGGAEASLAAADVYLSGEGLEPLHDLVVTARSVTARIKLCLTIAVVYNFAGAALAITGVITPLIAAILMPASSITVISIAIGSGRKGRRS